ncbi:MAG: hypothetical protein R6V50_01700 [Thermoplasmatota archaeon]
MITTGSSKESSVKEDYISHQVAANVLNSMLSTKVVCTRDYNLSLTEILQNCANYNDISCDQTNFTGNGNEMVSSCEFSELVMEHILNQTLDKWQVDYFLNITKDDTDYTNEFDQVRIEFVSNNKVYWRGNYYTGCKRRFGGTSKMFPVPLYPGTLWIELFVCD